jgi:ribosomal silencing factor RsfS
MVYFLRRLITAEELKTYLEQAGGQEVKVIQLPKPIVDITTFVIASFSSTRLIRKAAQAIQENVRLD